MQIAELEARPRDSRGRSACRRFRRQGLVPAVLYGHDQPNLLLVVRTHDVEKLLAAHSFIVKVTWDGNSDNAQVKEIQYDALGDYIVHIDLMRISLTETIKVTVPIVTHGQAAGVTLGGALNVQMYEIEIECLPTAIPEKLRVEVSGLNIGDDVRVKDMVFPEGVKPVTDPEMVVVVVSPPEKEEEAAEALAGEQPMAEPEVIGRRKAEEEEPEQETK